MISVTCFIKRLAGCFVGVSGSEWSYAWSNCFDCCCFQLASLCSDFYFLWGELSHTQQMQLAVEVPGQWCAVGRTHATVYKGKLRGRSLLVAPANTSGYKIEQIAIHLTLHDVFDHLALKQVRRSTTTFKHACNTWLHGEHMRWSFVWWPVPWPLTHTSVNFKSYGYWLRIRGICQTVNHSSFIPVHSFISCMDLERFGYRFG